MEYRIKLVSEEKRFIELLNFRTRGISTSQLCTENSIQFNLHYSTIVRCSILC